MNASSRAGSGLGRDAMPATPVLPAGEAEAGPLRPPHLGRRSRVQGALGGHPLPVHTAGRHDTGQPRGWREPGTGPPPTTASPSTDPLSRCVIERLHLAWAIGLAAIGVGCGALIEPESPEAPAEGGATVSVSGRVTFDYVPPMQGGGTGLDYHATEIRPARGVTVEILVQGDSAGADVTDDEGRYRVNAPQDSEVTLRVRAELDGETEPLARVLDNTRDEAQYTLAGPAWRTGEADAVRDLHAGSGWTGSGYGGHRAAAPFAILDVLFEAVQWVRSVDADTAFVPLEVFWSPDNAGIPGDDGEPEYASGRIGGSHYRGGDTVQGRAPAIYLVGAQDEDTDEYDRAVIAHEWMHYFLDTLSRDDSIGGPHALGEPLDMRVAYSEGMATALAAAMAGEAEVRYSLGPRQAFGGRFSVASFQPPHPGWFSEGSAMAIAYDLLDSANEYGLPLGFEAIHDVLVNEMRETPALTSVFAFVDALKRRYPAQAGRIDELTAAHNIGPVADAYGSGETDAGQPPGADTLPVYAALTVNGEAANVCSTGQFRGEQSGGNALGVWRFLRFATAQGAGATVSTTPTSVPRSARPETLVSLYRNGLIGEVQAAPGTACAPDYLQGCAMRVAVPQATAGGNYVLAVAEAANASRADGAGAAGATCFDVRVTSP